MISDNFCKQFPELYQFVNSSLLQAQHVHLIIGLSKWHCYLIINNTVRVNNRSGKVCLHANENWRKNEEKLLPQNKTLSFDAHKILPSTTV